MSGIRPPYTGIATKLNEAMTDDTTEATLGTRLAKAQDRVEELEAEVERLREALEEISEKAFPCPGPYYIAHIQVLKSTADNALDRAEDGNE